MCAVNWIYQDCVPSDCAIAMNVSTSAIIPSRLVRFGPMRAESQLTPRSRESCNEAAGSE